MSDFEYVISNKEIAVHNYESVVSIVNTLLNEGYVTMVSREENLYIINYLWSEHCDRNDVCFNYRENVEDYIYNISTENEEEN